MQKSKSKIIPVFIVIILVLSVVVANEIFLKKTEEEPKIKLDKIDEVKMNNWTIMIYLALDNHRIVEKDRDLEMLNDIGAKDGFSLSILVDGEEDGDTEIYNTTGDNLNRCYWAETESDTGNPNTLKQFIKISMDKYPAKRNGLFIISDQGSGWQSISHDTLSSSRISLPDFANIFREITENGKNKLDFLGLDMCITDMIEVAYEISPYIKYMVATQEHGLDVSDKGPEHVWQYKEFLSYLKENQDMTGEEFASNVVDTFKSVDVQLTFFYIQVLAGQHPKFSNVVTKLTPIWNLFTPNFINTPALKTTLFAINLSEVDLVKDACDELSKALLKNDNLKTKIAIKNVRKKVRTYGSGYSKSPYLFNLYFIFPLKSLAFDSYIDLYDLANKLKEKTQNTEIIESCEKVMESIDKVVLTKKVLEDDNSHGLSIYFPKQKSLYERKIWKTSDTSSYENLRFSEDTDWDEFLKNYLNIK